MFDANTIEAFGEHSTPFYYYDLSVLRETLHSAIKESGKHNYQLHYALKANSNPRILKEISGMGFGADCVSGNEVSRAVENGFDPRKIVFSGVGKSDREITLALEQNILCFNCESMQELEVINSLAGGLGRKADIALRINPNVHAYTHRYITTGLEENKFGINAWEFDAILERLKQLPWLNLMGLHFHIGSQITDLSAFKNLSVRVNEINRWFADQHFRVPVINLGGGLGIDYKHPDENLIPDFASYFNVFREFMELLPGQDLHLEPGRAVVAQCGSLITRILYIKNGVNVNFAICDAGMTELIRPALYQAFHRIQNITSVEKEIVKYDVVGPICESSDCFGKSVMLPASRRGDFIAIRSAGAYGETMASQYNLRELVKAVYSDELFPEKA